MKHLSKTHTRYTEKGSANTKLLLVLTIIILIANAGYNYIPTAYQAEDFKQDMETNVLQGSALPSSVGKPTEIVKQKLIKSAAANHLPTDAYINVIEKNGFITARVFYEKKLPILPFGLYEYDYIFDHSATPSGFLTK